MRTQHGRARILSVIVSFAMLLSLLPAAALAGDASDSGVAQIGQTTYETLNKAITAATEGDATGQTITLLQSVTERLPNMSGDKSLTIDLGGNTLTVPGTDTVGISGGMDLTIQNGTIEALEIGTRSDGLAYGSNSFLNIQKDSSITLDKVLVDCTGSALYPQGDAASVTVKNGSVIKCGVFAVGTNANNNSHYGVVINLEDSQFLSTYGWYDDGGYGQYDSCPVMINVPGTLNMDNCTVVGTRQGVMVRGGTAVIKDSTIETTGAYVTGQEQYLNGNWGSGSEVPMAALVLGNRSASAYRYPASCTLENTTLIAGNGCKTVYAYDMENEGCEVTFHYDAASDVGTVVSQGVDMNHVKGAGDTYYNSISEALAANESSIQLIHDLNEDVVIAAGKDVALDLNGRTLTNVSSDTIIVEKGAKLTVSGEGTVDNKTNAKAVIFNNGTVELNGGTYDRTSETGESADVSGGNSWYTLCNHGDMTINAGVTVKNTGSYSSMIENGYQSYTGSSNHSGYAYNYDEATNSAQPRLTITGGTFTGGLNSVKNDDGGYMVIEGGTFTNTTQAAILNWNIAEIKGGTFVVDAPNRNCVINGTSATASSAQDLGQLAISGGYFTSPAGIDCVQNFITDSEPVITGGYFTSDPSAFVHSNDRVVTESDVEGYAYMVVVRGETEADVVPATPSVTPPQLPETATEAEKELAGALEEALNAAAPGATAPSISNEIISAAAAVAEENTLKADDPAVTQALQEAGVTVPQDQSVAIVIQPYMAITITGVSITGEDKVVTLEIAPMYRTVATVADLNAGEAIVLEGGDANSAQVGESKELEIKEPVVVTVPLPAGFAQGDSLYVKHIKDDGRTYYYTGEVEGDVLTFLNPKGFSTFALSTSNSEVVAEIDGVGYASLQAAVDEVASGQTIVLKAGGQSAVVSREISFSVAGDFKYTLSAGSGYLKEVDEATNTYTFTYVQDSISTTTSYTVTIAQSDNGQVTSSRAKAAKGVLVTLTATPDAGYELDSLTVTDGNGNKVALTDKGDGKYTFNMPAANVTVKAAFAAQAAEGSELPFTDVAAGDWFYGAVEYAYENEMMGGISDTQFAPNANLTRGMIATILWRLEGASTDAPAVFTDVAAGAWYADAVNWAAKNNIVGGYGDGLFGPDDNITREQMAAILYRYAQFKEYGVSAKGDLSGFADLSELSAWAEESMAWAVGAGLLGGKGDGVLDPAGTATRAEVAQILMNFCENIAD